MKPSADELDRLLTRNVSQVIEEKSLASRLLSGRRLRIKLGADPTAPDLHLGHAVLLWKLKEFQDLGHTIVFIIGDFTARIGDPSGRTSAKKPLTEKEIQHNAKTYFQQVGKILDVKKAEVRYNSEWLGKLSAAEIIRLLSQFTISRILERDDFQKRLRSNTEVWMHETLYPIMQAYDSVAVKADVEIGGTDQLFNFMVARHLQERLGHRPQDIITFDLLVGLDGKEKMSKSLGNYIGITDSPANMFGKVMSLSDDLIIPYFKLATHRRDQEIKDIEQRLKKGENPRDIKIELASYVTALYHGAPIAERAKAEFIRVFSKKEMPSAIESVLLPPGSYEAAVLLLTLKLAKSRSEAGRLIEQGAVEIIPKQGISERFTNSRATVKVLPGTVIRVGKTRFVRIR
ncbi:MAG: tyrosine--tRNA ligase [Candidatus Sungbacteria bacterium]|nr:tyrosine--tRNA ligase [Candidatus Sungbacteria bacterium]